MYKNYVIFDTDNDCQVCVSLTENEARAIERFIDWSNNYDSYTIQPIEDCDFDKWGIEH